MRNMRSVSGGIAAPLATSAGIAVLQIMMRESIVSALLLIVMSLFLSARSVAMELKIVGSQIILSGPVVGDEPESSVKPSRIHPGSTR